jgi:hypothetical protein
MLKEELTCSENGQWSLNKGSKDDVFQFKPKASRVHESNISSIHTDPSINPNLGGKYGKVHGGDPRKNFKGPGSGDHVNADNFIERKGNKFKQRISGASSLRTRSEDGESIEE